MGVYVFFCGRLLATSVVLMMFIQIFLCWWIGSWFKTRSPNLLIDDCKECKDFSGIGCHEAYEFMLLPFVVVFIYQNMEDAWMSLNESPLRCRWKFELVWQTHIIFLYFLWQFLHPPIPMWRHGCHNNRLTPSMCSFLRWTLMNPTQFLDIKFEPMSTGLEYYVPSEISSLCSLAKQSFLTPLLFMVLKPLSKQTMVWHPFDMHVSRLISSRCGTWLKWKCCPGIASARTFR